MKNVARKLPITPTMVAVVALMTCILSFVASRIPLAIPGSHSVQPSLGFLLASGLVVIVGMAIVLWIAMKLGLNLSRATLFAVLGFNVALIIVKFVLSPLGLYITNSAAPFSAQTFVVGINNDPLGFWTAAVGSLVAYILSLWIIFKIASRGLSFDDSKKHLHVKPWMFFVAALVIVAVVTGQLVDSFTLAFIPVSGLGDYLSKLGVMLPTIGVLLLIAIGLAVFAFKSAAADVSAVGKPALLAGLFWFCLCLILMYHIIWVIFMTALVTIWPFKTFIPNSK